MVVKSIPSFYSKDIKFMRGEVKIAIDEPFILTGRGSYGDHEVNPLAYYWKLISGVPPQIIGVEEDGRTIKFNSPREPTEMVFELKVVDSITKRFDAKNIKIKVYEHNIHL
jgi:hypothetical protein